jgi:hypothetical protein
MKSDRLDLLPTPELASKWVYLLQSIREKATKEDREREFLFVHGWLRGLADAGLLSDATVPELRELAISACAKGAKG